MLLMINVLCDLFSGLKGFVFYIFSAFQIVFICFDFLFALKDIWEL